MRGEIIVTVETLNSEREMLRKMAKELAEKEFAPKVAQLEETGAYPHENMKKLAELGLLGVSIPEEYGGSDGTLMDAAIIMEEIAKYDHITALAALGEVGVQTKVIVAYGTEEQKRKYLPRIAKGECTLAICITEPDHGSDAGNMKTNAVLQGDKYIVNGQKTLISRADVADLFILFTRFDNVPGSKGVGCLLVDKDAPGLNVSQGFRTMGGEYLWEVVFDNCEVPATNLFVRENGFKKMFTAFNAQRCLNSALCLGVAEGAYNLAQKYTKERQQFGKLISDFQGIQWMLAEMYIDIEAGRALLYRAIENADINGFPDMLEAATAKKYNNEMSIRVANQAVQVHGGYGYTKEYLVERYYRAARLGALGGGTPQILKNIISKQLLKKDSVY